MIGTLGLDMEYAQREAEAEVQRLVDELESTLDAPERRLLHQLRLAAESLGAFCVASRTRGRTVAPPPPYVEQAM